MSKHKYLYARHWDGAPPPVKGDHEIECIWDADEIENIAEEAAEDFYRERDGWESSWPLTFAIFTTDGAPIGIARVDMELEPSFSARDLTQPEGSKT